MTVYEALDFKRGEDPHKSLNVGIDAKLKNILDQIDSSDLDTIITIADDDKEHWKSDTEDIHGPGSYDRYKEMHDIIKASGKVEFGPYFDWKERDTMWDYIDKFRRNRYVYDAANGQDGFLLVFSEVEIPNADSVDELYPK